MSTARRFRHGGPHASSMPSGEADLGRCFYSKFSYGGAKARSAVPTIHDVPIEGWATLPFAHLRIRCLVETIPSHSFARDSAEFFKLVSSFRKR